MNSKNRRSQYYFGAFWDNAQPHDPKKIMYQKKHPTKSLKQKIESSALCS